MPNELLNVALLCMTFDPRFRAVQPFLVYDQDYPRDKKTLYLMNQPPHEGKMVTDLGVRIVERTLEGTWPGLWFLKLKRFLDIVEEPITLWWDEDDLREHCYISKAIAPLIEKKVDLSYNMFNESIKSNLIEREKCSVGSGTLAIRTEVLRSMFLIFFKGKKSLVYYDHKDRGPYPWDGPFFKDMISKHPSQAPHDGVRGYLHHKRSTCPSHRKPGIAVDC